MFDTLIAAALIHTDSTDREWAIQRPSRGIHASAVREAATFPPSLRPWAACVLDRESGGTLDDRTSGQGARNPSSSAQGRWQMLDGSGWRDGGAWMVRDRLIDSGMPRAAAADVREFLASTPIYRWPGLYQDVAFIESVERGGAGHWRGHTCGLP